MNLKISVKNFGPIKKGEVELKDLNVFIGSNNAGKSYFATLVYTLMQSLRFDSGGGILYSSRDRSRFKLTHLRNPREEYNSNTINVKKVIDKIIQSYKSDQEEVSLDQDLFSAFQKTILDDFLSVFTTNLKRNMTIQLGDIVRFGENFFEIRISLGNDFIEFINEKNDLKVKNSKLTWKDIRVVLKDEAFNTFKKRMIFGENVNINGDSVIIEYGKTQISNLIKSKDKGNLKEKVYVEEELSYILSEALDMSLPELFNEPRVIYLPAARSGILQAHRIIAASAVQMSPLFGINKIEIPQMSGTIADFLSLILGIDLERSLYRIPKLKENGLLEISGTFENKIIHGKIDLKGTEQHSLPEIIYNLNNHNIPLNRTSSTVSELAPLFLLLKHVMRKDDMVIIEEPEAHLHPANQKLLAELINALVTKKIKLLITTHSDFLLGQLSLLIKTPGTSDSFIRAENTKVNLFKYDDSNKSTKIEKISISDQEGINEEEFGNVYEELYQDHLKMDLNRGGNEEGDLD
jgi:predicted ATPase